MKQGELSIVLVGTTHAGNIGAVARVMANMGMTRLRLVQPRAAIDAEAHARASGADFVLAAATIHDSLSEAVADAVHVVGTSARRREARWRILEPVDAAREVLDYIGPAGERVALVFGRESSGLTNAELDVCDALVTIPVDPAFPSLNLAAAVTVLAYEIRKQQLDREAASPVTLREIPATQKERQHLFAHLDSVLHRLDFAKSGKTTKLMRKIRYLCNKANPTSEEVAILRGILSSVEEQVPAQGPMRSR
jgi:tRNA (cytidine32/uridine32-2'-O)-methyltransferase